MTRYVVLLPGDESYWDTATAEDRAAVYAQHEKFARTLAERGHTVTGGAELTHSRTTKKVTPGNDGTLLITDGPYAETVEQLTGFYLIDSDDLDDLMQVCGILLSDPVRPGSESVIEVRAVVAGEAD